MSSRIKRGDEHFQKRSAGKTVSADLSSSFSEPDSYEVIPVEKWTMFDLWDFILSFPETDTAPLPRNGNKATSRLGAVLERVGMKRAKEVGEFYARNFKRLYRHLDWKTGANPFQFAAFFDAIAHCANNGINKFGKQDRIGNKTAKDYKSGQL